HDDSYVNPDEVGKADLKIAKHRNGAIGSIKLSWIAQYTRFENLINDDRFEHISEKEMDIAYANNMNNFEDPEPF
ncbi:MAG: DnaB-like helicase C-terminal domain-containing protein, partial [Gammaproteobacteria bacterium]